MAQVDCGKIGCGGRFGDSTGCEEITYRIIKDGPEFGFNAEHLAEISLPSLSPSSGREFSSFVNISGGNFDSGRNYFLDKIIFG